jgi:hypothetical protein
MANTERPTTEQAAAQQALLSATRRAGDAMPPFSNWLLAGLGAALALVVANIEKISRFVEVTHIRFGLIVFLASLAIAIVATYLSMVVKAALGAQEDGEAIGKRASASQDFNVTIFMAEYERGLLPPIKWFAHFVMSKARAGDFGAGARVIAKLSQLQALLVVCQGLLALVAVGALAFGLKME